MTLGDSRKIDRDIKHSFSGSSRRSAGKIGKETRQGNELRDRATKIKVL